MAHVGTYTPEEWRKRYPPKPEPGVNYVCVVANEADDDDKEPAPAFIRVVTEDEDN